MTPADGSDYPASGVPATRLPDGQAILLHGGRALLLFEDAPQQIPGQGTLENGERTVPWIAQSWQRDDGAWCGVAMVDTLPAPNAMVREAGSQRHWQLGVAPHVDISAQPLADLVRRSGADSRDVFGFLVHHLLEELPGDSDEARSHQVFTRDFFTAAAERDGFIEILGVPEYGGLFAQGWSVSLCSGFVTLASVAGELAFQEVEVELFDRDDILPPGNGFCLYGKAWTEESLEAVDAVFFESNGRLRRLDVVRGSLVKLRDAAATEHVRHMLPRLKGRAFHRICRPRFQGEDTLTPSDLPIAAAFDAVLQAPDGTLLVIGWLLDPLRRVDLVLLKSTADLYAPLNSQWTALPRPDLNEGFAVNPVFSNLLDPHDMMHGYITHATAKPDAVKGAEVYLELVLDDGSCLFHPVSVTPFESAERLPQVLAALSPAEPELDRIVEEHLAPFLTSVLPTFRGKRSGAASRPIPLGSQTGSRKISAIMPFRNFAELQPVFGLLAGTPEAGLLDLTLVTTRAVAADVLKKLGEAFHFYGLRGSLVVAQDRATVAGKLDVGVGAGSGEWILCWMPDALPTGPDWLTPLLESASALPVSGLVSPTLIYEDGSICFGGERLDLSTAEAGCALSGYSADRLTRSGPEMVSAGAAELALIPRDLLDRVGGFSGHLFSDAYVHMDLAARLRRAGSAAYYAGSVAFWMLESAQDMETSPFLSLMQKVDGALLQRRSQPRNGDPKS